MQPQAYNGGRIFYLIFLYTVTPRSAKITTNARKIKNSTLAIDAAPAAIPPNPKMAAIIAITKNIPAHFNIVNNLMINKWLFQNGNG